MKRKELLLAKGDIEKWKKQKKYNSNGELLFPCSTCTQKSKKKSISFCFPEEIIMDILRRLPVRSLQRFKCVSLFWNTLISDHYFIMKHLNHAKNDINSQKLLALQNPSKTNNNVEFYRFSLSSLVQVIEDEQRLDRSPNCKPLYAIRCCCDGLVLLSSSDRRTNLTCFLLWNPSTRESIVLPSQEYTMYNWVFGLGYDATNDDYKILVADLNERYPEQASVEILSLKSGSWRKIGKYPTGMHRVYGFFNCGMYSLAFIHGEFHWLSYQSPCNYTIISFNISNEVYGEIPLLERMYNMRLNGLDHGVSVLRGMLCYYSMPSKYGLSYTYTLWAMKEYGVKESWNQLHAIRDIDGFGSAVPHYMFADDDVLLCLKQLGPINSLYWTSKRGRFELWPEHRQMIVYTESLISPKLLI